MLNFNLEQENALEKIVGFLKRSQSSEKLFLLEGSAGTGKTSLITEIINRDYFKSYRVAMCATTNKALSVMQSMNRNYITNSNVHFSTIHKLIKMKRVIKTDGSEDFVINLEEKPDKKFKTIFYYDIIVIDECSMVSDSLLKNIIAVSKKIKGKIIFIGDKCQLPPINEEESGVFSGGIRNCELTKIERFKNKIIELSNNVRTTIKEKRTLNCRIKRNENIQTFKLRKNQENGWLSDYVEDIKLDKKSIILAYTNNRCNNINLKIRNLIFNNPKQKYKEKELIVFNSFYQNPEGGDKYYTSQQENIESLQEDILKIPEFSFDNLLNLKIDIKNGKDIDKILKPVDKAKRKENELICPICYEDEVEFGETVCGHSFCYDCLSMWIKKHNCCPYCRLEIGQNVFTIKNNNELSNIISNLQNIIESMTYKIWKIKLKDRIESDSLEENYEKVNTQTPIIVIHQDSEKKYKKDIESFKSNLTKMREYLVKHRKDKLVKIILTRLWEYLYYQILDQFADINYGYCITVHKSQGSTYDNVFVDINNILTTKIDDSQKTKCLYTAITRASNNLKLYI
jgi:hypothetical protein